MVTEYVMPPELQGKGIGDGPLPFVFGVEAEKLKQRYFMRIITPPNVQNEVWLEAYPRYQQQAAEFSKVQVILQISGPTKALLPYAIQIYLPNGKDRTVYQLQDPKINPPGNWILNIGGEWWKVSIPLRLDEEDGVAPAAGAGRAEAVDAAAAVRGYPGAGDAGKQVYDLVGAVAAYLVLGRVLSHCPSFHNPGGSAGPSPLSSRISTPCSGLLGK